MKKRNLFVTLLCLVAIVMGLKLNAFADLGNFNDYSSGSSGGSSYSGGYDGGYSSGGNYGGSYYYYSDSDDSDITGSDIILTIIVIGVVLFISYLKTKNSKNSSPTSGVVPTIQNHTDEIVNAITRIDPNFSSEKFIGWVKEVFITLQNAWSERDFEKVRPFEKEELYKQHTELIKQYIENGKINVLDRINVNQAYLFKYYRDSQYEFMHVYIQARMTDYIKDEKTGKVLQGNPNTEYHLQYIYTFMRKVGVLTDPVKSGKSTVACPHCGAPTSVTSSGKCEYCGFIITTGEFDWVLSNIEAVKPNTNFGNGGVVIKQQNND